MREAGAPEQFAGGAAHRWDWSVAERSADVALAAMPVPLRILDVGCGDGALLREIVARVPGGDALIGLDPAPTLAEAAVGDHPHLALVRGAAENLPFAGGLFDLVVSTSSFALWRDRGAGVKELARVVSDLGRVVIVDQVSRRELAPLLAAAGLQLVSREVVHRSPVGLASVRAFVAARAQ